MNILSNIFRKKFLPYRQGKRYISFKLRKSICYHLSKAEIGESGETVAPIIGLKSSNMSKCTKFEINVITNGSLGSSSILVNLGAYGYLFNCGENCIRAGDELKLKSSSLHGIFITSTYDRHFSGIVSAILTQKNTSEEIFLFGPPKINDIVHAAKTQNFLRPLFLRVVTDSPTQVFDDGMLKVKLVPLYHESNGGELESTSKSLSATEDEYVVNYICESEDFGLHLDIEACRRQNVPVGPLLQKLKEKKDITLDNGKVVHWKDVCYFSAEGSCKIIFADCPTAKYLDSLLNEKEFISFQSSGETPATLVIHFTPPEIMKTEKYRKWMSLFSPSTEQLIVNKDNGAIGMVSSYFTQQKMNYICPSVFPLLDEDVPILKSDYSKRLQDTSFNIYTCRDEVKERTISVKKNVSLFPAREVLGSMQDIYHDFDGINVVRAIPSLTKVIHPHQDYEWHFKALNLFSGPNEFSGSEKAMSKIAVLKDFEKNWMNSDECKKIPEYPKILFLGTGSGEPAKHRAPSGIMVFLNPDEIVLFDCGEGTYHQMSLLFGPEKIKDVLKKIILIFVSHFHIDHHFGLLTVLSMRVDALKESGTEDKRRLVLIVPNEIKSWLKTIDAINKSIIQNLILFSNIEFPSVRGDIKNILIDTELRDVNICFVVHCLRAWGISIILKNGYKITYSGDTMPSDNLIQLGQDSNILIHESTFDDYLTKMAQQKSHSTLSQAIQVGLRMKAKYVILTHFSQRYYRCPLIDPEKVPKNVGVAYDFMFVNERLLPLISKLNSIYGVVFEDEMSVLKTDGLKSAARYRRSEDEKMRKRANFVQPGESKRKIKRMA